MTRVLPLPLVLLFLLAGTACSGGSDAGLDSFEDSGRDGTTSDLPSDVPADTENDMAQDVLFDGTPEDPGPDAIDDSGMDADDAIPGDTGPDIPPVSPGFRLRDLTAVGDVHAMWASQSASVWAVGEGGLVLRWNGLDFVPTDPPPTDRDLLAVTGYGDVVFVAGAGSVVLRHDADGWTDIEAPAGPDLLAIGALDQDEVYAVGREGRILHWAEGAWAELSSGVRYDLHGLTASRAGGVRAVGQFGNLLELEGRVWIQTQITAPGTTLHDIWRGPDGRLVTVGSRGAVLIHDGVSWKPQLTNDPADPLRDLHAVFGFASDEVYAVGDQGAILRFDGNKWLAMTVAGPYGIFADLRGAAGIVLPDGSVSAFAAGLDSAALDLRDLAWHDLALGIRADLHGIDVADDGTVTAVGEGGLVMFLSGGRVGTRSSGTDATLRAVAGNHAVGDRGTLLDLAGNPVILLPTGTDEDLTDVWAGESDTWIVGSLGSLFRLSGGDLELVAFRDAPLRAVCPSGGYLFLAGDGGRLEVRDEDGARFLSTSTSATLRDLAPHGVDRVMAVGDFGIVLDCGPDECRRVHEEPTTFLYGVDRQGDRVVAAGWAGTVIHGALDGDMQELATGTFRVFKSVKGARDGSIWYLAGLDGAFGTWQP